MVTPSEVVERLKSVKYPGYTRDIVSFGLVKDVQCEESVVLVRIELTTSDSSIPPKIKEAAMAVLEVLPGVSEVQVNMVVTAPATPAGDAAGLLQTKITGVKRVIAVASGKGGVGKSTVAANLALALGESARVGLCDCDIYGPSIALMFGSSERPDQDSAGRIVPIQRYGIHLMSMGFLLEDTTPAILRGPMVTKYVQQFLRWVDWPCGGPDLDYLILDLPPGTGDIQLTIVQTVALSGAIIVTTPQEVALIDARKAASMFEKVNVPIIGLIENMSYFVCPNDGNRYYIFGEGGGEREAKRLQVPLLAQIPLEIPVRESGDRGLPIVQANAKTVSSQEFIKAAKEIRVKFPTTQ
jgi:ATP-binding protein involved in chromosome partitioning